MSPCFRNCNKVLYILVFSCRLHVRCQSFSFPVVDGAWSAIEGRIIAANFEVLLIET